MIDDDEAICTYLSALLEDNAVTIEASNSEKDIAPAKAHLPDLILIYRRMFRSLVYALAVAQQYRRLPPSADWHGMGH